MYFYPNFFNICSVLRIWDVYPGSWFLPIPDPISKNSYKREGWKKTFVKHFFVATNFTKCKIILSLNCSRKNLGQISKNYGTFLPKKLSLSSQKYEFGIQDLRSGIPNKPIPDPGSRIQGSKRHRIPDPDPQHCICSWKTCVWNPNLDSDQDAPK